MYRLLYMSFTVFELEPDICAAIVNSARRHNATSGITGTLLTSGRTFLQLLEGDKDTVLRTFRRIRADPRHDGVQSSMRISRPIGSHPIGAWDSSRSCQKMG